MHDGKPTVLFNSTVHPNGCEWYRIRQPGHRIIERGWPAGLSNEQPAEELEFALQKSDIVVSQHVSEAFLEYLKNRGPNQKVIFDHDDNVFKVSPYNPAYQVSGPNEVEVEYPDGQKLRLWENGKAGFDMVRNRKRLFLVSEILKNVDLVTTPSSVLSGVFKSYGAKKVKVIKNFVDGRVWKPVRLEKDGLIRIGYQGGWSHYEDWHEIGEALVDVMARHRNTILVIMGQTYPGTLKDLPEGRVQTESWAPFEVYPWKFKTLNIDIGIAPLANNEFNICKSEIKWEEYSALGIPTVASNVPPYSLSIAHGKTGMLASGKDEWSEYLSALIESEERRRALGDAARAHVLADYELDGQIVQYENAFNSLFKKELIVV